MIWTNCVEPPPPGFVVDRGEPVGFVIVTLPTEAVADDSAAAVAAVERSPATAAKAVLKFAVLKIGNRLLDEQGRFLIYIRTGNRSLSEPGGNRRLKPRRRTFRQVNEVRSHRRIASGQVPDKRLDGTGISIRRDDGLRIRLELTDCLIGNGWSDARASPCLTRATCTQQLGSKRLLRLVRYASNCSNYLFSDCKFVLITLH